MATIQIDRSSSRCLSCNKGASPSDPGHITIIGYGVPANTPGCGEPWTAVKLSYSKMLPTNPPKFVPEIGMVFENLRGLPIEGTEYIYPDVN